jgi:uncharacterized repeat protein (TIGR02543 family)
MKTLRRLSIAALLALLLTNLVGPPAWAASVNCITTDSATGSTITGSFTITDNVVTGHTNCSGTAIIPNGVTKVGGQAFVYANLTSVTIPSSVISIGSDAFVYNGNLTTVNFEGNAPAVGGGAFYSIGRDPVANVGASAELFGTGSFWNGLRVLRPGEVACTTGTFTITDNVVTSHTNCAGSAVVPTGVTSIGDLAFDGASSLISISIPDTVTSIGGQAFRGASSLTSITIPKSVTSIGSTAFQTATNLASITFDPESKLTTIGPDAFVDTAIQTIAIPNSVTSIGYAAFAGARFLTSVTIPNSVTSIGDRAFAGARSLKAITIPNSVTSIGEGAFDGASSLKAITIPKSVISIGNFAFRDNTALQAVTFETDSKITSLAYKLFWGATALSTITIPNSVTEIGEFAFYQATSLASITIPSSVTSIREGAFWEATSLASITFDGNAPSASDAFNNGKSGAVAIISSSTTGFTSDPWNLLKLAVLRNVTFNENGGTGTMSSQGAAVTTALSTNAFSRDGFTFAGWNTAINGSGVSYSPGAGYSFESDATLYAQWTAITYSVTFNANGGTGTMSSQVAAVTTALTTNTFTRDGFTFAGWTSAAEGTGGSYAPGAGYSFASDATLYAQWTAIPASPSLPASPRASEPAPNPAPLKTTAPEPTPPTQRASTPGGTVAGSTEKLIISAGPSGDTITARGSDWQLEIASVQGNGKANPATGDSNLVFQPSSTVEFSANGLMPSAKVAFWVFSDPTFVGEVETDSTGRFESNLELPEGLAPGEHTLQVLSRDSKGRAITLNFPILVQGEEAYETVSISQKVNVGSFNRSIAVYAKGHKGKTLSWKTAGKWSRKTITSDYQVFQKRTAAVGLDVNVQLYLNGEKQSTKTVRTR